VAVADVWDALTSERAYRPAWSLDRALSHIVAAREILFDPTCVDAFLDALREAGVDAERTRPNLDALAAAGSDCHPAPERRRRQVRPRTEASERAGPR
jgi:hypothetical protein